MSFVRIRWSDSSFLVEITQLLIWYGEWLFFLYLCLITRSEIMKHSIILFFLLFTLICRAGLPESYRIQPINNIDALPDKEIHYIFQDSDGYIWFGTADGLCRYDGYSIKIFRSAPQEPSLLQDNMVLSIGEDSRGLLWIGTGKGVSIYDRKTGAITPVENKRMASLYTRAIYAQKGLVWIGTEDGLFLYDEKSAETREFRFDPNNSKSISGNKIRALDEDSEGNLWVGTFDGGFCKIDPKTLEIVRYPSVGEHNRITSLFIDKDDVLWLGAWRNGVCKVLNKDNPEKTTYEKMGVSTRYERLTNSFIQVEGNILLGTGLGIDLVTPPYNPSNYHYSENLKLENFPNYEVNRLYKDRNGIIWIATKNSGVFQLFKEKTVFTNYLYETLDDLHQPASIFAFHEWGNDILLGVEKVGVARFNKKTQEIHSGQNDKELSKIPFPMGNIRTIVKHPSKEEYYLGSDYGGLFICASNAYSIRSAKQYLPPWSGTWPDGDRIQAICCDLEGNVWIGSNLGLNLITASGEKRTSVSDILNKSLAYQSAMVDDKGNVWFGTEQGGIVRIDNRKDIDNLSFCEYTKENGKIGINNIQCLYQNKEKEIFAGTNGGGLYIYNEEKDCFEQVNGMESFANEAILSIIESDRFLYMGTKKGLLQFDLYGDEGKQLMVFTQSDGLLENTFNPNAVMKDDAGHLYFGTSRGFTTFDPKQIEADIPTGNLVISDIKIFHNSFDNLPKEQQKRISPNYHPTHSKRIILSHKEYSFGIEFATLSYKHPEKNRYAYKLEGFDKDWNYVTATNHAAYYTNMKSGTYRFLVKGTHENSFMNPEPEVLEIIVLPPPYKSWWAYTLYFVLFLLLAYVTIRILRYRSQMKLTEMEHRKNEELAQAKFKFFTNISHELLTPLTIIGCSAEELQRKYNSHDKAWKAIKGNVFRLNKLLEQILEFKKVEKEKQELKVSYGDAGTFITNLCKESFSYYDTHKNINFTYKSEPKQIPAWFDKGILDIIMYNLISNAFKYNKMNGQVAVSVETNDGEEGYRLLNIRVGNTGDGLTRKQIDKLFQRFQVFSYNGNKKHGNGIGLHLTKALVELHKGVIEVSSIPGEWTEFSVSIPICETAYADEIEYQTLQIEEQKTRKSEQKDTKAFLYKLLLIEDDVELLLSISNVLSGHFAVITAIDGESGLQIAKEQNPDLIISDVMLPKMTGFELCKLIKEDLAVSHIPVILLTAKVSSTDKVHGLGIGADAYITKPFDFEVLLAQIRSILLNRQKLAERFRKEERLQLPEEQQRTSPDQKFLEKAIRVIENNIEDPEFTVQHFLDTMNVSNSMLYRKLKALTGLSPNEFIRSIRLKKACAFLRDGQYNVSEVAYMVGFNDPKYFSKCFKEEFGKTPTEFQNG